MAALASFPWMETLPIHARVFWLCRIQRFGLEQARREAESSLPQRSQRSGQIPATMESDPIEVDSSIRSPSVEQAGDERAKHKSWK